MGIEINNHPAIKIVRDSFAQYRAKSLDIAGLQQNLATATTLLEGSLPQPVRECVEWVENEVEGIRFTTTKSEQAGEVDRVWSEIEEVLARHGVPGEAP